MADQEQLEILKQGVQVWNSWREKNPNIKIDLNEVDLPKANLVDFNFRNATLIGANLIGANLISANLREANIIEANLSGSNLRNAYLFNIKINSTNLSDAKLSNAFLINALIYKTDLSGADLSAARLYDANLINVNLDHASLNEAIIGNTIFSQIDLSGTHGLQNITHYNPSTIGTDTIQLSKGEIPETFLRGCGLSDWEIESAKLYKPTLNNQEINNIIYKVFDLRANQSIQISPLFISYSHADTSFIEKLETYLLEKGIRFWRDVHNATAGRLETQVDRAMRQNPTVLLVLSKSSTSSDWVEHEARLARQIEKEIGKEVLCPIALDDSWKTAKWPARLMEQIMEYNILDFSKWEDNQSFEKVFNKMLSGLDMFYKPEKESSK